MINNKRAQMGMGMGFILGIVMLVVAVVLMTALWPIIQDSFDDLRDQSELNCKTSVTEDLCETSTVSPCYNSSAGNVHSTTCSMISIGPPILMIFLILGAIGLIVGGGIVARAPQQYPPQY